MTLLGIHTPRFYQSICLGLLLATLSMGCEHAGLVEPEPSGANGPTFTQLQDNIFSKSCALSGCHTGTFPPQGLNLTAGLAYNNLVGVQSQEKQGVLRVAPGDPANSYIIMKITGAAGIAGGRMPLGRTPLSSEQIESIRLWIQSGALNN